MKNVTFYLGPSIGINNRNLVITRMPKAGDDTMPSAYSTQALSNDETEVSVALPDNQMWQATLQDEKTTGELSVKHVLNFHTGSLQFPGPACNPQDSLFRVYAMEDMSSSSSSSSVSSSSSSSVSSSSPSSSSSASSSSSPSSNSSSSPSSNSSSSSSNSSST